MNPVKYDSPSDVYKRLAQAGIVSSSDIIQRAIQGYYSQQNKFEGSCKCESFDKQVQTGSAGTQIKRHAIRKSLEGIK